MDFKGPYLDRMISEDPKMFMDLRRSGRLDQHLAEKSRQAHKMLADLLSKEPKDSVGLVKNPQAQASAEEIVRANMMDFPAPLPSNLPEPPEDLGRRIAGSSGKTTGSSPAASKKPAAQPSRPAITSPRSSLPNG